MRHEDDSNNNAADHRDPDWPPAESGRGDDSLVEHGFEEAYEQVSAATRTREGRWKFWGALAGLALLAGIVFQQAPVDEHERTGGPITIRLWGTDDSVTFTRAKTEEDFDAAAHCWPAEAHVELREAGGEEVIWRGGVVYEAKIDLETRPARLRVTAAAEDYEPLEKHISPDPGPLELDIVLLQN